MPSTYENLREAYEPAPTSYLPTGLANIDHICGGGFPRGKVIEIHSEAGIGKTTILLQASVSIMDSGGRVLFLDVENSLSDAQKYRMGASIYEKELLEDGWPQFVHLTPITFDEIDEVLQQVLKDKAHFSLIILDSITMAVPDRPDDGQKKISAEEAGHGARVQARFLRLYKGLLARAGTTMVILNQMRTNLKGWRAHVKPAGGKALEFVADIRMGISRAKTKNSDAEGKDKTDPSPTTLTACTIKNKHAAPFDSVPLLFTPGLGVDDDASLTELLIARGLIEGGGGWYALPDVEKNVRKEDVRGWVTLNRDQAHKLLSTLVA